MHTVEDLPLASAIAKSLFAHSCELASSVFSPPSSWSARGRGERVRWHSLARFLHSLRDAIQRKVVERRRCDTEFRVPRVVWETFRRMFALHRRLFTAIRHIAHSLGQDSSLALSQASRAHVVAVSRIAGNFKARRDHSRAWSRTAGCPCHPGPRSSLSCRA